MAVPRVVLELDKQSRVVLREGRLVDLKGVLATVRWADGSTDEVRLAVTEDRILLSVAAGGLRHRKFIDPVGVSELVSSSPAQAFAFALFDSTKAMTSKDLIARVEEAFEGDVSALWKRARLTFEAIKGVKVSGKGATLKYTWVGEPDVDEVAVREPSPGQDTHVHGDAQTENVSAGDAEEPADPPEQDPAVALRGPALAEAQVETPTSQEGTADERMHPGVELVRVTSTSGRLPEDWRQLLTSALRNPLATGLAVDTLPDDVLQAAIPVLGRAALVLQALPRSTKTLKAIDAVELAGPDGAAALIDAAGTELRGLEPASVMAQDLQRAHGFLLRRLLTSPKVRLLALNTVLRAIHEMGPPKDAAKHSEWVAGILATVIGSMEQDSWLKLELQQKSTVARLLASAPLDAAGPRARVLGWIWRNHPADLADDMWWRDVEFAELAAIATTPLAGALESDAIASSIVKPLVAKRLKSASTRRQLLTALAAPAPLARLMDEGAVQQAFDRVLRDDNIAKTWLVRLRNEARISQLVQQVEALTRQTAEMTETVNKAREATQLSADRLHRVEARLAEAAASTGDLRKSQSRQIRIDVMRALAGVCAYVDGATSSQSAERIRQRVGQMAAREGLTPVGSRGVAEPYDPRRHDVVGQPPLPGAPVTVTGIGYTWDEGPDEIILVRALVERSD